MKSQVKVYARLRPLLEKEDQTPYEIDAEGKKKNLLRLYSPRHVRYANQQIPNKEAAEFVFSGVFDQDSTQDEVFDGVAKSVVNNCLDGYNGTIFAYGQTGSGKTYTMSGADSWQLRGIIPRVITHIFDEAKSRGKDLEYKFYVSYMEIYNENCYDLLNRDHIDLPLEQWSKVIMLQDDSGNLKLKNISLHQCESDQKGVDLLLMGNFMRQISSTPMNQSSSRSHCIFTITIDSKSKVDGNSFKSKLHLIDLAGSERISKGHIEGNLMTETKHINLSLTYLEQVIIALKGLQQGKKIHIPYRNSAMTMILKDSLGGNCKTSLITCLSIDPENFEESISTCRFAQRCGQLEMIVKKNEVIDYPTQVKRLKSENANLLKELENYKKLEQTGKLPGPSDSHSVKESLVGSTQSGPKKAQITQAQMISQDDITPELIKSLRPKIEDYLRENIDYLDCHNLFEAHVCLEIIKQLYNTKMKEYIKELGVISNKLNEEVKLMLTQRISVQHYEDKEKPV